MPILLWTLAALACQGLSFEDKRLATLPADAVRLEGQQFSADGRAVTFWINTNQDQRIVYVGGKPGPAFDLIRIGRGHLAFQYAFSPDGKTIAYVGAVNGRARVVVGDRPHPVYDEILMPIVFSADGRRTAYPARNDGRSFLVVDGTPKGLAYDHAHSPMFSPDGKSLAFVGVKNGTSNLVVDDKEVDAFGQGTNFTWGADGTSPAYAAYRDGQVHVVAGGRSRATEYDRVMHFQVGTDGRTVSFIGHKDGKQQCVWGDRSGPVFDTIQDVRWSPDGSPTAYWGRERVDGKDLSFFMLGDRRGEGVALPGPFVVSPDGKRAAYVAREGRTKMQVILDGKAGEPFFDVSEMVFSKDGASFAHLAADAAQHVVVLNGRRVAQGPRLAQLKFCADQKTIAYGAILGPRSRLVVGDTPGKEYDGVNQIVPSPRGTTVAAVVHQKGKAHVVAGNRESAAFDFVATAPVFSDDGTKVAFGALRGAELWWKVMDVK